MPGIWWEDVSGPELAQGDILSHCSVPIMPDDFEPPASGHEDEDFDFIGDYFDLIVLTQSCDLEQKKAKYVATCPYWTLEEFEAEQPEFAKKGVWEQVRKGRHEGLHMLAQFEGEDNRKCLVADFHQIHTLPLGYLSRHAESLGTRKRLKSPYLEHFSQSFARFFMRVGLPGDIAPFK